MAKHIIVDSLARSGTTLISALLRSQERSVSFCPGFNEPLSYKGVGSWPHGLCRRMPFISNLNEFDFNDFKNESLNYIIKYKQFYHLNEESWEAIIMRAKTPLDLYARIDSAFQVQQKDLFFYRWNQCLAFAKHWFARGDDFKWICVIRNPLDRACSSSQKHDWSFEDSLKNTVSFSEKIFIILRDMALSGVELGLSELSGRQFQLVYYEDLVSEPEKTLKSIYGNIGENLTDINLTKIIGSNGKIFMPQTSENKHGEKIDGYVTGKEFSGFYDNKIGRYKRECSKETYEAFKSKLIKFPFYQRYFKD